MTREEAEKYRSAIVTASESLTDEIASTVPDLFPKWEEDTYYNVGDRRRYNEVLYKCLTAHESQASWTPDVAHSLWVRTDDPGEEWPQWVQPQGSTDAYAMGAKVSYDDRHWISDVDNNVWTPGVYGWSEAT